MTFRNKAACFKGDRRGNFAVMTSILIVPLLLSVGLAVDYSRIVDARSDIQAAVDAAAMAAVAKSSENYKVGGSFGQTWTENQARKDAMAVLDANQKKLPDYKIVSRNVTFNRVGPVFEANVSLEVSVPTMFMGILGVKSTTLKTAAVGKVTLEPFVDVYLLADNTPSMGLGATPTDVKKLEVATGCAFACHDLRGYQNTMPTALKLGIQLRIDSTREAITELMATLKKTREHREQYRIAGYTFGTDIYKQQLTSFVDLSSDMDKAGTQASTLALMTTSYANSMSNMATNFQAVLASLVPTVGKSGSGTSTTDRRKLVLLITDGVNTTLKPSSCPKPLNAYGQCQSPIDPKWCDGLKANGANVAVLYTTYYPVVDGWYNAYIKPFRDEIGTKLAACATPGMYAEVQPHEGIKEALETLFFKSAPPPRLAM